MTVRDPGILVCLVLVVGASCGASARADGAARKPSGIVPELVWHVETADGRDLSSRVPDEPINPASLTKIATTLWALERLGPEHRFETRFGYRGTLDPKQGILDGDLVVEGGGDPDFQAENAFLVAQALNELGLAEVRGSLRVDTRFWIGWEGGAERRKSDPVARARQMAQRLRVAFDPTRWNRETRASSVAFRSRRALEGTPPRLSVRAAAELTGDAATTRWLVVHRSNPLATILRRFNVYSNNDIERLAATVGSPAELTAYLGRKLGPLGSGVRFETLSGLGTNRLTPRQAVRLLYLLREACQPWGLDLDDLLPVAGCDPGTLDSFPKLAKGVLAGSLVGKTGTLTVTDGGVAALAGFARTAAGSIGFCVVAPEAGAMISRARTAQERFVLEQIATQGGPRAPACSRTVVYSDHAAQVIRTGEESTASAAAD